MQGTMSNVLRCPACDLVITSEPAASGKIKPCPRCGKAMTQRVSDPLVGRSIAGCRLVRRIGMGAMAVVYEAEQLADHQHVAIKMLTNDAAKDAENGRRFAREAQLCKSLSHPNVVAVHRHGNENGIHFMVMELIDGAAMEGVIDRHGAMPWRQIAHLILQIGQALDHIGKQGIIHRDIKPANILLTTGGVAKLVDLGFAKRLKDGDSDLAQAGDLTMQGVSMGSPAYMPPEQVLDAKQATHSADIYSLGATFFHAATGQTPFNGRTAYEIMEKVLKEAPTPPRTLVPDIPIAISQLIEWAMEKDPDRRPASAGEFVRELEIAMFAPDDAQRIRRLRRSQRKAWILPAVIGGALALVGGLLWFLLRTR
jgi:serine/threonine protein kinase